MNGTTVTASNQPSTVGELPRSLELVLGNEIYIAKDAVAPALRNRLLRVAAFQNPGFYKAQAMRPSVVICKVCGGNRTTRGAHTHEVLARVLRTI